MKKCSSLSDERPVEYIGNRRAELNNLISIPFFPDFSPKTKHTTRRFIIPETPCC